MPRISKLPAATSVNDTDIGVVVQSGVTKRMTHLQGKEDIAILSVFWGDKTQRLIEAHATDHTKVTVNKGAYYIPLLIGTTMFLIDTATHVSSVDDIDTGAIAAGTDYFVYACNSSGTLVFKTSTASTYPSGFAAATSRKIGGFHTLCAWPISRWMTLPWVRSANVASLPVSMACVLTWSGCVLPAP